MTVGRRRGRVPLCVGIHEEVGVLRTLLSSGSCFVSHATKRLAQTRFNKHDCVATGRARCAIRREGRSLALRPKEHPSFCAYTWSLFVAGVQKNFVSLIWRATSAYQFYVVAFLKKKHRNLTAASSLSLLRALDLDRGWSMTLSSALPIVLFALALTRRYASGQSTSSAIFRKRSNLFARSSISFVTGSSI